MVEFKHNELWEGHTRRSGSSDFYSFKLSNAKGTYGYMLVELVDSHYVMHMDVIKNTPSAMRDGKKDWENIKVYLKFLNIYTVWGVRDDLKDEKSFKMWDKFLEIFGFETPKALWIARCEV